MADPQALLDLAERTAQAAARHLRDALDRTDLRVATKGTDTDMVTDVDRAAERLIVTMLLDARPDDGIVGEEGTAITGSSGVDWIIDPLDGTTNFVYGYPGFSVSIGAHIDGRPTIGVVADPILDELYSARDGGGAHRNGAPIRCSALDHLPHALVATGFSYDPNGRRRQAQVLSTVLPAIRDIRRSGGAAFDLCSVACARVDASFERGLQPWDLAAGAVIAAEAGARVGDLDGGPPSADYCLSAPPVLFEAFANLIRSAEATSA